MLVSLHMLLWPFIFATCSELAQIQNQKQTKPKNKINKTQKTNFTETLHQIPVKYIDVNPLSGLAVTCMYSGSHDLYDQWSRSKTERTEVFLRASMSTLHLSEDNKKNLCVGRFVLFK